MTLILESKNYRFEYRSESGSFNLFPFEIDYPVFKNCRLGIVYTRNKKQYTWSMTSQVENEVEYKRVNAHIGSMDQFSTGVGPDEQGVYAQLIFELLDDAPFFLWKIKLENRGDLPIFIERFDLLRLGKNGLSGELEIPDDKKESLAFFSNGWQSWSLAATYGATEKQRHSRLGVLTRPMDKASDLEQSGRAGHFVSDFFGVLGDRRSRWGVVAGFLSQREQFGVIEAAFDRSIRLNMWASGDNARLDPGASMQTDWAVLSHIDLSQPDPLGAYLELTARENGARSTGKVYSGWCSWYEYHQNITEKVIR
ncbi:MAG: hypothetical protein LWX83_15750, partial [Anaerolineae bacterium]|nr:hypothetical protein [Anaerolineae bacterium]